MRFFFKDFILFWFIFQKTGVEIRSTIKEWNYILVVFIFFFVIFVLVAFLFVGVFLLCGFYFTKRRICFLFAHFSMVHCFFSISSVDLEKKKEEDMDRANKRWLFNIFFFAFLLFFIYLTVPWWLATCGTAELLYRCCISISMVGG